MSFMNNKQRRNFVFTKVYELAGANVAKPVNFDALEKATGLDKGY
jgi:hypothetical protein